MSTQMKHRGSGAEPKNHLQSDFAETSSMDSDERYLTLHRQWKFAESFSASFAAMYVIGGIRATFYIGVEAGGPAAYW
ncbi:unnamed protein product [Aureobasidium uvarum]|uniref:Uncharacterized protein n=1 Tax=Aureobasidium uvarum TaxID=2773716 RepID=A0A9N8KF03_9PEZI|nr:unnamed protein product [Aureobasidium uvarum]